MTAPESHRDVRRAEALSPADRLFCAELALHEARQTRVDAWICAAADRLHDAVVSYMNTQAASVL